MNGQSAQTKQLNEAVVLEDWDDFLRLGELFRIPINDDGGE